METTPIMQNPPQIPWPEACLARRRLLSREHLEARLESSPLRPVPLLRVAAHRMVSLSLS